jgi:signal transduction histidine kinase
MKQRKATKVTTKGTIDQVGEMPIVLSGWHLMLTRLAWIVIAGLSLGVCVASFPYYVANPQLICSASTGCVSIFTVPDAAQALQTIGLSVGEYVALSIALTGIETLISCGLGCLLFWRKSQDLMVLLVALLLFLSGTNNTLSNLTDQTSLWQLPARIEAWAFVLLIFLVLALFPNGRFVPRWTSFMVIGFGVIRTLSLLFPPMRLHTGIQQLADAFWFAGLACLLGAQLYRYRRASSQVERQQTKWVIFAIVTIVVFTVGLAFPFVLSSFVPKLSPGSLYSLLMMLVFPAVVLLLPLSLSIAVLRYRLWDIDLIINRTLVYGLLTASVIGIYILVVGTLGTLLQAQGNFLIALLAAGLIAVLFQPLRLLLQRGVNRLMYGERDTPGKVISRLGQRLETTLAPDAVLPTIVETVAQALKLPYAAITLKQGGEFVAAASYGQTQKEGLVRLPLVYQNEQIGELLLAPRAPGETFSSADHALLGDLARQAGIAASAVRLTTDLQRLADELQHSRTQLVTTREEERRRLRRDLHDGLGPALGSLTLQLDTVRNLFKSDPTAADALLVDLKAQVQTAITDIRRLVYELRPPTLDELGLVSALREQVTRYRKPGLFIRLNAPEYVPPLPAAVEVAIYRITQEALTNVLRHANAQHCELSLEVDDHICLEVRDDGQGLPADYRAGVGLTSMRERAAELGGTCAIEPVDAGGTRVFIRLPLSKEEEHGRTHPRADRR